MLCLLTMDHRGGWLVTVVSSDLFQLRDCSISTRNKYGVIQPRVRTTRYGLNSVRYDGARLWNKSENKLKVDDIKVFKQLLKEFKYECKCNVCTYCIIHRL